MVEEPRGNGQGGPPSIAGDEPQEMIVSAEYVKDLSFENPRAQQSLTQQTSAPEVDINVDVKARNRSPEVFEVVLTINATARSQGEPIFLVELAYGTVVTLKNTPPEMISTLILVETPRLVFPFARSGLANATGARGFPPCVINPVDCAAVL